MRSAQEQQRKLEVLLTKIFDESLGSLTQAKIQIDFLRIKHEWHHYNFYQLDALNKGLRFIQLLSAEGINPILQRIREEKERSKQFLYNELNRLNDIRDRNLVEQYLNSLRVNL